MDVHTEALTELFQSRLPGVGGSAADLREPSSERKNFQSRLPGVGGSALTLATPSGVTLSFNPVCRELGAPPPTPSSPPSPPPPPAFNPVCRELGAPPRVQRGSQQGWDVFQSRLPGVGGSAEVRLSVAPAPPHFQSRLPGVGGSAKHGELLARRLVAKLSIPFAGSWGCFAPAET